MIALTNQEIRVLASLIEKESAVPESYPLTLTALRSACNQSTNRRPVVTYDDRTVETALTSLKSAGLVRFVHPSHGGRTTRYRHTVGDQWRLSIGESLVVSALALRGAQTVAEIRSRIGRLVPDDERAPLEDILDTLAARRPEPLIVGLGRRAGERDDRWAAALGGLAVDGGDGDDDRMAAPTDIAEIADSPDEPDDWEVRTRVDDEPLVERIERLAAAIDTLAGRLDHLERELGIVGRGDG